MNINSKLPNVGTTIFATMTNLANQHGAINLSQGFPDFDVDPRLVSLVGKYMKEGFNQYAPFQGVLPLREKLAAKTQKIYGCQYDPEHEVTVTAGATEALFVAIMAAVNPGDEVIVFDPAYDCYVPAIELAGGTPVHVGMDYPGYGIDWDRVGRAVSPKTRMMVLNFPHNPTGAVLTSDDIASLEKIVENTDILILSDEVYEHIVFDGKRHESMACHPELASRSFVVSSFGKTYHATGWKVGYCFAPKQLTTEFRKVHQYLVFAVNTPVQMAFADFLDDAEGYLGLSDFYQKKRDLFLSKLGESRFKIIPCTGSYFQMLDYSSISDMPDVDFSRHLTMEVKVAAIPPSVFYKNGDDHKVVRLCFAKKDDTLEEAALRLCEI